MIYLKIVIPIIIQNNNRLLLFIYLIRNKNSIPVFQFITDDHKL